MAATYDQFGPGERMSEPHDWSRLLADNRPWMRCVALARLGEAQAVDEVLQEIAVAAVEQKSPLLDTTRVGPWLYRLVLVHSLRHRRSMARQRTLLRRYQEYSTGSRPGEGDDGAGDPLQMLLRSERQALTAQAVRRLPGRDAEILMLKYGEQWSYQRIAEYLGISADAVDSRMHRARQRLRTEIQKLNRDIL